MIGSGLTKLAKQHEMTVANGIAYGGLMGYATTLCEGSGYKQLVITAQISEEQRRPCWLSWIKSITTSNTV